MSATRLLAVVVFLWMLVKYGDAHNVTTIHAPEGSSVELPCDLPQYDPQKDFLWVTIKGEDQKLFLRRYAGSPPDELQLRDRNRTDISLVPPDFTSLRVGSVRREDEDIYACTQPQAQGAATRYQLIVGDPPSADTWPGWAVALFCVGVVLLLLAVAAVIAWSRWHRSYRNTGAIAEAARVTEQEQEDYISLRGCCSWVCCPTFNIHYGRANLDRAGDDSGKLQKKFIVSFLPHVRSIKDVHMI